VQALARLPDETALDGEVVALDESGRPSFNALQNASATGHLCYYVFDVAVLADRELRATSQPPFLSMLITDTAKLAALPESVHRA
jgi:ATP-dependent DNA ligase